MKKSAIDNFFKWFCFFCASLIGLLMLGFFIQLSLNSKQVWDIFGWRFLISTEWDPVAEKFGALPSIVGTLSTTLIALIIALPLALAAAMFLVNATPLIRSVLGHAIDLLAAIPSVIYGMWGLFVLVPFMQDKIQPFLAESLKIQKIPVVGRFLAEDYYNGFGILTGGLILAIMILPYICAILRDVLQMTPPMLREAAYGVGCTRLEAGKDIVIPYAIRGILGGVFVGLGRALGETMAVLFVIGNMMEMPQNAFSGSTTIAATIANSFPEADGLQRSALFALGLLLLAMSLLIQILAQSYLRAATAHRGE